MNQTFNTLKRLILCLSLMLFVYSAGAQRPKSYNAAEILLKLKKLNFLGAVLYVAAHPDDENTRLITYLANERLAQTAYLSLTRGDGGQNLIGPEIREELGLIRTQELLSARRIDGGKQFFTRANDFGYSKNEEETQRIWDRDAILSDVVWVIRKFRPDVIITRFPPDERGGHGHHTASAILAAAAFDLTNQSDQFADQLRYVKPWQPKRLFLNTGRWWNKTINENSPGVITVDVGKYSPLLGRSYTEIAAESRSQHKSQGFGATGIRGQRLEFLEFVKGDSTTTDIFEGIDTSWGRAGAASIGVEIDEIIGKYDPARPQIIVADLLRVRKLIAGISDDYWRATKLAEIEEIIKACTGLFVEVVAQDHYVTPGQPLKLSFEAVNRSGVPLKLKSVRTTGAYFETTLNKMMAPNSLITFDTTLLVPVDKPYSQPYWLVEDWSMGMYSVWNRNQIGKPENDPTVSVTFDVALDGESIGYHTPVVFKWNDPVDGEQYRPLEVTPPIYINLKEDLLIFSDDAGKKLEVTLVAGKANIRGKLILDLPSGWKCIPENPSFALEDKYAEQKISLEIYPPKVQSQGDIQISAIIERETYSQGLKSITYDHIKTQTLLRPARSKMVKLDIEKNGQVIGYIQGAGDDIPKSLRSIGYEVWELDDEDITPENLRRFDAVILGVRALNTNGRSKHFMNDLLSYVEKGGNLIVQYNTYFRLKTENFSPFPIKISRDRIADENAPVKILVPGHPALNYPNKITEKDFEGWVQERGLYFPNEWDERYVALLSSNDPNEEEKKGGLLVTQYGKGYYVYTGYSWFRELPAGVPGAFRIFANLISLGSGEEKPTKTEKSQ